MVLAMIFFLRLNLALACFEIFNAVDQWMGRAIIKRFLIARMLLQTRCGNIVPQCGRHEHYTGILADDLALIFLSMLDLQRETN
jgi:hypothetical protein